MKDVPLFNIVSLFTSNKSQCLCTSQIIFFSILFVWLSLNVPIFSLTISLLVGAFSIIINHSETLH